MTPFPSRVSERISRNCPTCINCLLTVLTTVFSSSRAEKSLAETCTDISGIAMSGNNEIVMFKYVITPRMKQAVNAMKTAIGRCIRNFIMIDALVVHYRYAAFMSQVDIAIIDDAVASLKPFGHHITIGILQSGLHIYPVGPVAF